MPGPVATSIDTNKWYFIKLAGTEKYMMISGHRDVGRSMAKLTVNEILSENKGQQWRFVPKEPGSAVYTLENRRYRGSLVSSNVFSHLEFRREKAELREKAGSFSMVANADKSWFIFPQLFSNKRALSTWTTRSTHCLPYYDDTGLGGRVIHESECTDEGTLQFVRAVLYSGKIEERWTLEEAKPLNSN
ncbi:MAG TPA: hypothetical protein VJV05_17595 [Pyrinomonadaceae bacterium]|nr:hypothetical protein [Pyrinomonadaceae bacterium]